MERSQIHRVSIADQVASVLRQRILDGELRPGTPLQELSLAASLGVSRNTMREALRILALEGLLHRNLHRGLWSLNFPCAICRDISSPSLLEIQPFSPRVAGRGNHNSCGLPSKAMNERRAKGGSRVDFDFQFHVSDSVS
jgi:DNA-binding transcriptional MocR family regulator